MRAIPRVAAAAFALSLAVPVAFAQAVGSEFQVNTYTTGQQRAKPFGGNVVASDASGNFVVVWSSVQDESYYGIFGQRFDSAGGALGSEFRVNSHTQDTQQYPSVAAAANGNFVVVWDSYQDGSSYGIFGQRFDSAGGRLGGEFQVNTFTPTRQEFPSVASDAVGNLVVVWASYADGGQPRWGIFGQRYDSAGVAQGGEFRVNTFTPENQRFPSVASNASGAFVVAWHDDGSPGQDDGVFAQRYDSSGVPQGPEFRVNSYTSYVQKHPSVALDASGNFVVAWQSVNQDGGSYGIFAQRFDSSGVPQGPEFRVNTYTTLAQFFPSVASDASGNFIIAWGSSFQDGGNYGTFAQHYDSAGVAQGGEFLVNSYTTGNQVSPSIAATGTNQFVVAWESNGQDGSNYGIFGQRLDFSSADTTSPSVTVVAPNGGELLSAETPVSIQWTASDDVALDSIDVEFSTDGGTNFSPIVGCTGLPGTATSCSWDPGPATTTGLIRVTATDTSANSNSDVSDATFTVRPALSVNDVTVSEADGTATFTVSLSSPSTSTVTVKYKTANGTAMSGSDYTAKPLTTLTFTPGQTSKPVVVSTLDDNIDEADGETFFVNLSVPTNAVIAKQGIGTIEDDDPTPTLSIGDASVTEGDSGTQTMTFTLTLSPASGRSVSVTATTGGAGPGFATPPADYTAKTQTLTFSAGQTSKTFSVTIKSDTLNEPNEIYNVDLSNAPNASITDGQGVGTIVDNDSLAGAPSLSIGNATVTEGDAGTTDATFTVSLSGSATQTVTVHYATMNGTAMSGSTKDYLSKSGNLTFLVGGGLSQNVTVKVNGDMTNEADEIFFVNLSSPVQATIFDGQATGTIDDNDPTPDITIADANVTEGNSGTQSMSFAVTLTPASGRIVTVHYATAAAGSGPGFATAPADYTTKSGTLTFSAGQTSKTISITIKGDLLVEGPELFNVNLGAVTNATIGDAQGVGTISDDEFPLALGSCGDGAGPGGNDIPCSCEGTVVSDTTLDLGLDPISTATCTGNGLTLAAGVQLDLNGVTLNGSNAGNGLFVPDGGGVQGGTVRGFGDGVTVSPGANLTLTQTHVLQNAGVGLSVHGGLTGQSVEVGQNTSHGVLVDTGSPVTLTDCDIHDNGQAGVLVLRADGDPAEGIKLNATFFNRTQVHDNAGDGVVLGDLAAQTGTVNAAVSDTDIFGNQIGLRIEENDAAAISTHWRIASSNIYLNRAQGVYLRPSFPNPPPGPDRRAFTSNLIHANARPGGGATCSALDPQTAPQVVVDGPPPFEDATCATATSQNQCHSFNDPVTSPGGFNHGCAWNQAGGECRTAYDLSGVCDTGSPNALYNYAATGLNLPNSVGLYVLNGAAVNAQGDLWEKGGKENQDWFLSGDPDDVMDASSCHAPPSACP